nr:MAG: GntR family transcriptional regulator [Sphaerobacter thermophilus]
MVEADEATGIAPRTVESEVTDYLRRRILSGAIPGGTRLNQEELAQQLGVSRTPVREALKKLATEGLVTLLPHRGALVSELSLAEIEEMFDIRAVLEGLAMERATPRVTPEGIARAWDLIRRMDGEPSPVRWLELNRELHESLYAYAGMPRLSKMVHDMRRNVERYLRIAHGIVGNYGKAQQEHRAIVSAVEAGDAERAGRLTAEHLRETGRVLVRFLRDRRGDE